MSENLTTFSARTVIPIETSARKGAEMGRPRIIENGAIEVTKGIITYIGESRGENRDGCRQHYWHYNVRGHCLLPGFVDSHTHFVFDGECSEKFSWRLKGKSYMSVTKRDGGVAGTVKATRQMNFLKLRSAAEGLLKEMSAIGVITIEGESGYGLDRETELLQLKIMRSLNNDEHKRTDIVPIFLEAYAPPEEYKGRGDEHIDFLVHEMLPVIRENELTECCDVFCEQGVFSVEQSRRPPRAAKEQGFLSKPHADEIVSLGGAELAAELGALSTDHLFQVPNAGIRVMADVGVVATLLSLMAFVLKEPYAHGHEMTDAGCAVAFIIDLNPESCFFGSIPLTIALACICMKLSIEEAIAALILNGVVVLHRVDRIGSTEVGKQGDLVVLNPDNHYTLPYIIYTT